MMDICISLELDPGASLHPTFIDTNVTGLNVMKNILGSQQEPSQRGLKNI